jgi:hypothetical protein
MTLKASSPTREELAFCAEVNKGLPDGKVSAYSVVDDETRVRTYGLVFALGSKRKSIQSNIPSTTTRRMSSSAACVTGSQASLWITAGGGEERRGLPVNAQAAISTALTARRERAHRPGQPIAPLPARSDIGTPSDGSLSPEPCLEMRIYPASH